MTSIAKRTSSQGIPPGWRGRLHHIIFGWETPAGKAFDVALIAAILLSVLAVMLDSVASVRSRYGGQLDLIEWVFTILFTIEYLLRLLSVNRPLKYALSFFGIVDLIAVVPTYLSAFMPGAQYLLVIRLLRILRVFRVLKLVQYVASANVIMSALRASIYKISVFMAAVLTLVTILGAIMYAVEGGDNGFSSIPLGIYWAVVTLTTVGYGDIAPQTGLGQALASVVMLMGYAIIAVPTGIVTTELARAQSPKTGVPVVCPVCTRDGHSDDAVHCKYCGGLLLPD